MSKRVSKLLLEDILDSIRKINNYISGIAFQDFIESELISDAVVRNIEIIGEAVNKLPEEFRAANTSIEWQKISGVRNRVIHEYFGVDLAIIWYIINNDLPEFRESVEEIQRRLT